MDNKFMVVLAVGLFCLFLFLDFIEYIAIDKGRALVARIFVGIAIFAAFGKLLSTEKSQPDNEKLP